MRFISTCFLFSVFLTACKKPVQPDAPDVSLDGGMLVLCEGLFQQNNSSISWVDFDNEMVINHFFEKKAGRQLGDTGNDMIRYGSKMYVVVNISSTVEVLSVKSGHSLAQISMIEGAQAKQPRSVAGGKGKLFVTCYDGYVDVIDTTTFEIENRIPVGSNPEGIVYSNGKLFVSNSGGLNFPNYDSTVSVIDLASMTEIEKIAVGVNPGPIVVDHEGDVYVISRGDYGAIPSRMHKIDPGTSSVTNFTFDASTLGVMNDRLLVGHTDFVGGESSVALFDAASESIMSSNWLNTNNATVYNLAYNPSNDRIYLSDAGDFSAAGYVHEYSSAGSLIRSFHVSINPSKMVFFAP